MPVIFTVAQQIAFDEGERHKFCKQLLLDLQGHYDVSPEDIDAAILYSKEADKIGLPSEVTQSRYILTGLLIEDSPIKASKHLKQSLKLADNEASQAQILD